VLESRLHLPSVLVPPFVGGKPCVAVDGVAWLEQPPKKILVKAATAKPPPAEKTTGRKERKSAADHRARSA
jgi:hypothetical protein